MYITLCTYSLYRYYIFYSFLIVQLKNDGGSVIRHVAIWSKMNDTHFNVTFLDSL